MSQPIVALNGLSVGYSGKPVLNRVDLSIDEGTVYVLLGRNGEGKTTLARCLLGQLPAQAGEASILGRDAWSHRKANMQCTAYVPESPRYAPGLRVADLLRFFARVQPRWDRNRARHLLASAGVADRAVCDSLSRGQKTQLSLLTALASRPRLLICDDPTLGLDPVAQRDLLDALIVELAERRTTVLVTTHDLAAFASVADHIGILHNRSLIVDEPAETLRGRFRRLEFDSAEASQAAQPQVAAMLPLSPANEGSRAGLVVSRYDGSPSLQGASVAPLTLEQIFIALVGHRREDADA